MVVHPHASGTSVRIRLANSFGDRAVTFGRATVGVNYWLTRRFVVKLSGHHIAGTHFVLPDAATGRLNGDTRLLMFGAQFSF